MQSAEAKPAFQTIQFPEPIKHADSEAPEAKSRSTLAEIRLLTPQEVANRLGVSERWVRDHATRRSPRIRAVKLGPLLRFRLSDIEDFLIENSTPVPSKKRLAGV
jgi:excisionase family DNA binding protein